MEGGLLLLRAGGCSPGGDLDRATAATEAVEMTSRDAAGS